MTLLEVRDLVVRVGDGPAAMTAVAGVDLEVGAGGVLGLVGESGSGKSTLARAIVGLTPPRGGRIMLDGHEITPSRAASRRAVRRRVQLVFQDSRASLNPRMTVGEALREAITLHRRMDRTACHEEVRRLLEQVAMDPGRAGSRPGELSGGQCQRVALARALAVRPDVIIADEITAALDVSVQGAVLNLLRDLRDQTGLALLVISHNLAIVRHVSDEVAVMHLGRIVERAETEALIEHPEHPYTRMLIESASLSGFDDAPEHDREPPDPLHPPAGCRFHTVCPVGPTVLGEREICRTTDPGERAAARTHRAACHYASASVAGSRER